MRQIPVWLLLLALSACAANVVRLEHASAVSTQATATVNAANAYLADVRARRREANIALVASDPHCGWGDFVTTDTEWAPPRGFCDVKGVPAGRQVRVSLKPISEEALKGLTVAIAGIATYQAALADVLDDKPDDAKAGITDAIDKLSTASSDINRIAGEKLIDLGPLTGDPAKAVIELVGTLAALEQTNMKVESVRHVVAGVAPGPLYGDLKTGLTKLADLQDANSTARQRFALEEGYAQEVGKLSFADRRDWIRQIAAAADEDASVRKARLAVLTGVVDKLATSDGSLRNALAGKFTPEERRRIARENRTQILGLLSKVAALFPAI